MPADITGDFSASSRVTDMDRAIHVEGFDNLRQIGCIRIHLVAF
jgi:hypothetical protein